MISKKVLLAVVVSLASFVQAGTVVRDQVEPQQYLTIKADVEKGTISKNIYGHFAEHLGRCIYEGFWVGENSDIPNIRGIRKDVVEALKKIKVPVLRWPGGCFADKYHWMDGIGPRKDRPAGINTFWGGVIEDNSFGTHEFMDLCEMLGADPYIAGNVGSGTVEEMQEWVEYMTADIGAMAQLRKLNGREKPWKVPFFGVGNENWGCGGEMSPEYYADEYRRYQSYVIPFPGNEGMKKVACGPGGEDLHWVEVVMRKAANKMDAITLHRYVFTGSWDARIGKGSATSFTRELWVKLMENTLRIDQNIDNVVEIMDKYDRGKRVELYVDEWGTWWDQEPGSHAGFLYQQNTMRDAVSASIFLNSFNEHCNRVKMANIAQINNVLQAMILTDKEKMIVTPTYHVFELYAAHHNAKLLESELECNPLTGSEKKVQSLTVSVSKDDSGTVNITVGNIDPENSAELVCDITGISPVSVVGKVLAGEQMNSHNTFENPNDVKIEALSNIKLDGRRLTVSLPPHSVSLINVK